MGVTKFCRDCRDGFDSEELRNGRCQYCWVERQESKEQGVLAVDTMMRRHREMFGLPADDDGYYKPSEEGE